MLLAALACAWSGGAAAQSAMLFDSIESGPNPGLYLFPDWEGVVERHNAGSVPYEDVCEVPPSVRCFLKRWNAFLATLQGRDKETQIEQVQQYFSPDNFPYKANAVWETPLEFYFMSGDCKDYSVAKYMSLRYLGFNTDELRIVVGKVRSMGVLHAVLVVYLNGQTRVLDSLHPHHVISPESFPDFRPTYAVNETDFWQYRALSR